MKPVERTLDPHAGFIAMGDRCLLHKVTQMSMNRLKALGKRFDIIANGPFRKPGTTKGVDNLADATDGKKLFNPKIHHLLLQIRTILDWCLDLGWKGTGGGLSTLLTLASQDAMISNHQGLSGR